MAHPYVVEEFTPAERSVLERFFTNVEGPVFAVRDLPEVVKGALFARYSRTPKSLRRLFLDEFWRPEDAAAATAVPGVGSERARELYDRIFIEFGDDSVAQLGGAHLAVEQASNLLTKAIEWSRLAAYLEQSTRYIAYDDRPGGRWRYYREPRIAASPHAAAYERALDEIFASYAALLPRLIAFFEERFPRGPEDTAFVWRQTIKAKACDTLRGMLPAATVSNVGIYASGQAFENMILRMRASPLTEVREVAGRMLAELDCVIPVFLQRVDQPERGGAWTRYLREAREATAAVVAELLAGEEPEPQPAVTLTDWDPDAEERLVAAMLYATSDLPEEQLRRVVATMGAEDRLRLVRAYAGERANRRHKPGRALERIGYRFDVLCDYGAFRDLQRHRMLTIEWQDLTPRHGFALPPEVSSAGARAEFEGAMERSAALWERLRKDYPVEAQYAVCMAYRIRFVAQMSAREAMHLIELRSSPQGHPAYREVAQEMWRQIRDVAGHRAVAEMMRYVDFSEVDLERLEAERRAERKRRASGPEGGAG